MRRFYIVLPVLAALLLAGCGNNGQLDGADGQAGEAAQLQEGTPQPVETADPQAAAAQSAAAASPEPSAVQETAVTPEADSAEYKREIAFDIDAISDPIVNDEIKTSLKDALEGIVNEDLKQFNSAFTTPDLAKANEYGFKTGGGITFTGVDYISNQPEGRVVMNVNYIWITADGEERSDSPNYWFMQSKEGKWGLVTID
ncbi:hypothetical protein [Paenibacillus typhae]|uniref:hypothetical protein n=1 Tax=Paenibacillus typhae TaxID=1174501 RepID=UPI001C8E9FDE|nr:hypothetical protein [Paenibacillus typhae]MBY0013926.1 hypothetical protein [Paenibacillus typhae]